MVFLMYSYQITDPNTRQMNFDSSLTSGNLNTLPHPQNILRATVKLRLLLRPVSHYLRKQSWQRLTFI